MKHLLPQRPSGTTRKAMIRALRKRWASQKQGLCIWCGRQTWITREMDHEQAAAMIRDREVLMDPPDITAVLSRRATIEHVIPRASGGKNIKANVVCACAACNHTRGHSVTGWTPRSDLLVRLPLDVQDAFQTLSTMSGAHHSGSYHHAF